MGRERREDHRPTAVAARLTLVSHARAGEGPAARFPVDSPLDVGELRRATTAAAAVAGLRVGDLAFRDRTARTRQTAQALGLAAVPDAALADLDVGVWAGRRIDEVAEPDLAAWVADPAAAPHGGESVLDLLARVRAWIGAPAPVPAPGLGKVREQGVTHVVAVTHPAVVRAALVIALRCPPEVFWRIDVPPLTATRLHWRGGWTLRHACRPLK